MAVSAPAGPWSGAGDFNGLGRGDLLFQNTSGAFETWDMNGSSIIGVGSFNSPGAAWTYFGVANLNPGLRDSIILENTANGALAAYLMNDTTVEQVSVIGIPASGATPVSVI